MINEDFSQYNGDGTLLRKVQLRLLDILSAVDNVCQRNNIEYWLDSGTLLGAVRHGGFIPWDDDVDICVERKNYKKLRDALIAELPEYLTFVDWTIDSNFFDKCGRVIDRRSVYNHPMLRFQRERGLVVDIIIVERTIPKLKSLVDKIYGPTFRQVHNFGKPLYSSEFKRLANKCVAYLLYPLACFLLSVARLSALLAKPDTFTHTYGQMFQSVRVENEIFPLTQISFEGKLFFAPGNYDAYLKRIYGDYLTLPPSDKRVAHEGVTYEICDYIIEK